MLPMIGGTKMLPFVSWSLRLFVSLFAFPRIEPVDPLGDRVHLVQAQPQRLANVTDGRARAIGDHLGGDGGPLAAVFLVDVLEDLLAALVLEIDVDVRRLVALAADEALEEQIVLGGVDRRDPQAETHGRIRRRPAPLAQNPLAAREADEVVDGEEVMLVAELPDQGELLLEQGDCFGRDAGRDGETERRRDGVRRTGRSPDFRPLPCTSELQLPAFSSRLRIRAWRTRSVSASSSWKERGGCTSLRRSVSSICVCSSINEPRAMRRK